MVKSFFPSRVSGKYLNCDFSLNSWQNHHNDKDSVVKVRKCERMRHALWLIKDTTKEGSSCFLADKSYFKNPLVTQCTIIITSCLSIQYPGFDFFVFLAFSSEVSFKIPHEKGKVEERFLKWKKQRWY